jgi:(1->4)-alpha-D-glucan 1-alpha-D-glucosylmutase
MPDAERAARIPRATYRLQLSRAFTLRDATALVPYFARLGVSHLYCSPYMRARPGSSHGYDVVDHNSINPEIGSREDLERFVSALRAHGMGHILDWVPNHVGVMGADNTWWMDVLENGPASIYAQFFDIAWENVDPALAGKLLVPVLGDTYGNILERGELVLRFEGETGSFAIFYHEHRLPIDPREYPRILERALAQPLLQELGEEDRADFSSLIAAFGHLPDRHNPAPAAREERNRDKEVHKRRLLRLCGRAPLLPEAIAAAVHDLNGAAGEPRSFDALHELLESQPYRLAYWRVAADEINYRRFFDVNDLAALRMENEAVFEATHRLVLELIAAGKVDGLRIDHPDGLYDPAQYFRRLQSRVGGLTADLPLYLVVEKIAARFEPLRDDWRVHGTTGYRFANVVSGVTVDQSGRSRLDRIYRSFTGSALEWRSVAHESKRLVEDTSLAAEVNVLANELRGIARAARSTRDFTQASLRQALAEVIACFPVYRTYIAEAVSPEDRKYIDWAIAQARTRESATDAAVFDFVRAILLGEGPATLPGIAAAARRFAMRFQQVTAPVTAKGIEDTALYRFDRLVSLNEVGGEPEHFGTSVREFHADARYRARHWPHELLATSTHDTKRSEDVRSRINALSELPSDWRRALGRWSRMNRPRKRTVDGEPAPSANDEYLLYQTLLGTFPLDSSALAADQDAWDYTERIVAYMIKAVREAKLRSSWANVNGAYEEAVQGFTREVLEPRPGNVFLADLDMLARRIARVGHLSSLSQMLCKLTAPGVPDIYQGTELWDFSLVDPDNRRPIDYEHRHRLLRDVGERAHDLNARPAFLAELLEQLEDGRAKLFLIWRALQLRAALEPLFARGAYLPLRVKGARATSVIAFMRRLERQTAITIAPRLYARLLPAGSDLPLGTPTWGDTWIELPRGGEASMLTNDLDGIGVPVREVAGRRGILAADALANFPVALVVTAEERRL